MGEASGEMGNKKERKHIKKNEKSMKKEKKKALKFKERSQLSLSTFLEEFLLCLFSFRDSAVDFYASVTTEVIFH